MNKFFLLVIFAILNCSCSTYVPIQYRVIGEFGTFKNTPIIISFAEKNTISHDAEENIKKTLLSELITDDWWKIKTNEDKVFYEIIVNTLDLTTSEEKDGKTMRRASYQAVGTCEFSLKKNMDKDSRHFYVNQRLTTDSEVELPNTPSKSSLRPVVSLLLGMDSEIQQAINRQNLDLEKNSFSDLNKSIAQKIISKISPVKKWASAELESGDGMDSVEKFVKQNDYQSAFNYLTILLQKEVRSDVLYNLGVIQEARQMFAEGCALYQKAYELKAKSLYLEQKSACETRLSEMTKVKSLN